jgi:hypothetical protein
MLPAAQSLNTIGAWATAGSAGGRVIGYLDTCYDYYSLEK